MMRINLVIPRHLYLIKGIYKISIGGKFYIGSAHNLYLRISQHEYAINRNLEKLSNRARMDAPQYISWIRYITSHDGIKNGNVEVLQRCITDSHLYFSEQRFINEYIDHPDCLNKARYVPKPDCFRGGDNKRWDVRKNNKFSYTFFNPDDTEEELDFLAPLNKRGKFSVRQDKNNARATKQICDKAYMPQPLL